MKYSRVKALLLSGILAFALALSSCGKTAEAPDSAASDDEEKEEKEDKDDKDDKDEKEDRKDNKKEDKAAKAAYEAFLNGEETVFFDDSILSENYSYARFDGNYTIQELADLIAIHNKQTSMPDSVSEVKWSYIDCGEDGISELALDLSYESWYEYESPSDEYFIIKNTEDGLKICYYETGYYRTMVSLYDNGFSVYGGSGGAAIYDEDLYVVDADGNSNQIYSLETIFELGELRLSPDVLPMEMEEVLCPDFNYGNEYELHMYHFPDEMPDYSYDEYDYEEYACSGYYVFYDTDGNAMTPDKEYISLCADHGIRILTDKEINKMIEQRKKDLGIDAKGKPGNDVSWESIDAVVDRYSVKVQTELMADNTSVWMWTYQNEDFNNVQYAVTDLNLNGRLEVIRCESYEDDNTDIISRAYIYEVDEDLTSITERRFNQGGDAYISFLPVNEEDDYLAMMVFFKTGSDSYTYVVPTNRMTGYGYDELHIIMNIDGNGNAEAYDTLAKRVVGMEDDDIYYIHDKEVDRYEFLLADQDEFPISDGYNQGQVIIDFDNFETADDLLSAMRQNACWEFYFSMIQEAE